MPTAYAWGVVLNGVIGERVRIEVDISQGLPSVGVIGLADTTAFELGTAGTNVKAKCTTVLATIEENLKGEFMNGVHCLCSPEFFAALTGHAKVEKAFENWQNGAILINDVRRGFTYGGITFEEYRGQATDASGALPLYEFEPSAENVLDSLLPQYITNVIWNALLLSAASEHAARRRAMKSATDNAEELIKSLTRLANQARQAEITQEISEIVGGADALASAK